MMGYGTMQERNASAAACRLPLRRQVSVWDIWVLKQYTQVWSTPGSGVLAVPRQDAHDTVVLTAWQHRLRLERIDPWRVRLFLDAFRGAGPETPRA